MILNDRHRSIMDDGGLVPEKKACVGKSSDCRMAVFRTTPMVFGDHFDLEGFSPWYLHMVFRSLRQSFVCPVPVWIWILFRAVCRISVEKTSILVMYHTGYLSHFTFLISATFFQ